MRGWRRPRNNARLAAGLCTERGGIASGRRRDVERNMFALNDNQLKAVMIAAGPLSPEKRSVFLERVAARLQLHGSRFNDADLDAAVKRALRGLIQNTTA